MPWTPPGTRNRTGIRHESLRTKIDLAHELFHDELGDAYYNYWKFGDAKPFPSFIAANRQWNVLGTAAENEAQFEALQAFLHHAYVIMFHQVNVQDANYPADEYNNIYDNAEPPNLIGTRSANSIAAISDLIQGDYMTNQQVQALRQWFIQWVKTATDYDITMA